MLDIGLTVAPDEVIVLFSIDNPPGEAVGVPDFLPILIKPSCLSVVLLILGVIVISGLGDGSRDLLSLALLAAANTSAIELLKVRGIAPEDSVLLNNWELLLLIPDLTVVLSSTL
jgi:hypothetical protein